MNIIQYTTRFCQLSETFIYGLVCGLQRAEPGTRVLSLERLNVKEYPFDPVDIHPLATHRLTYKLLQYAPTLQPIIHRFPLNKTGSVHQCLLNYFRSVNADVVHVHFATAAIAVADTCHAAKIPLVVSLRGYDASRILKKARWRWLYRWLFRKTSAVVVVSSDMRERIKPLVPTHVPIHVIHAGKNPEKYVFKQQLNPVRKLLSVGRLVEKKGHDDAIRAVHYARSLGADISLQIIGDGALKSDLATLIDREGLSDHVSLLGALPHNQVIQAMQEADAVVLACRTGHDGDMEGIPNVLKEAQLIGLPVVSTNHSGIPDVIPKENHDWLAHEGDWQQLGKLLHTLACTTPHELVQKTTLGREHIVTHFSATEEVRRHLLLYERIQSG